MAFDVEGALKEGYSRKEIADYLASRSKFDVDGARQEGYSDDEIISHLSSKAAPKPAAAPKADAPKSNQPEKGLITRVGEWLRPEPKSVMDDYTPPPKTPEQQQADRDKRLSYGAGPISPDAVAQADQLRSGLIKSQDPTVNRVAQEMERRGEPTFKDIIDRVNDPALQRAARQDKAEEWRSPGEWAADTLSSLSQGVVSLVQLPTNIVAPDSSFAKTLRDTQKELQAQESDVVKAQRDIWAERVRNEEGFFGKYFATVQELATNPALGLSEAFKQVPMFLGVLASAKIGGVVAGGSVGVAERASPTLALGEAISGGAIRTGATQAGANVGGATATMVMAGGDAAQSVYERLTDKQQTPLSEWQKNPDYQQLLREGKTSDEAIQEIATTKARLAAVITAPLGLLGYMGAEASLVSRGMAGTAAKVFTPQQAAKIFGKELIGEQLEEGGTQLGANLVTRTVDPRQNLLEGVPEAMGTAAVTSAPFAGTAVVAQLRDAIQQGENSLSALTVARNASEASAAAMNLAGTPNLPPVDPFTGPFVPPEGRAKTADQTAAPDYTMPAGPMPQTQATPQMPGAAPVDPAAQAAEEAAAAALTVNPATERQFGLDTLRQQNNPPLVEAPRPQKINGTPTAVLSDAQLEEIVQDDAASAIARRGARIELDARRRENTTPQPGAGVTSSGINLETRREPTLDIDTLPGAPLADGRVEPSLDNGFLSIPDEGVRNVSVAPVGGESTANIARRNAQASLDAWAQANNEPVPATLTSPAAPELESAVNEIAQLVNSQFAGRIYAYSDSRPEALNGLAIGQTAFVNTANVDINAARTSLHEFKHTVEQIALAESRQGQTNTPAQQFVASIDSIYDDMTEVGKRAYLEKFLAKAELDKIADPAAREARIQELLADPGTRSEMTADFLGNRATDKQFLAELAAADPQGFKGFVEKWLKVIDNLLAALKGKRNQGTKESARVDLYIRDLNKAKMVAREALIAYSKATRQPQAAAAQQTATPQASNREADQFVQGIKDQANQQAFAKDLGDRVATEVEYGKMLARRHSWLYNVGDTLLSSQTGKTYTITGRTFQRVGKISERNYRPVYSYEAGDERGTMQEDRMQDSKTLTLIARGGEQPQPSKRQAGVEASAENENRMAVVVGAKPGEFNWNFTRADIPPPPFSVPTERGPRLEKIGEAVHRILTSSSFKKLAKDAFGIENLRVAPLHGSWLNKPEPSFAIYADGLTFDQANELSKMLGFAFAQDATVVYQPTSARTPGEIPAVYIGSDKKLTDDQMKAVLSSAQAEGIDYSSTADGKAVKFLHFGDEAGLAELLQKAGRIADAANLKSRDVFYVRSQLNEAENYTQGSGEGAGRAAWVSDSDAGSSGLFGRTVDSLLVPYAKAVGAEGYRFAVQRFAERFGLDEQQQQLIRSALIPKNGSAKSTVAIASGAETLDVVPTSQRGTKSKVSVNDILWALQNRSAQAGLIEPGDYSDQAKKVIAEAISDEVIYHINSSESGKSAIGWYDRALKAAKVKYESIFPELKTDKNRELMFDAVLGITSQGNDVFSNSLFAVRVYQLIREGKTLSEAVKALKGTFGGETVAIENNLLKLEELINRNGYDAMRAFFNKKDTVSNINARLRSDTTLFFKGKPLQVDGGADQTVTGWMVFGPKIGSFINNLHGDYSTLTADLWFSRTWNRILGFSFVHAPALEAKQYQNFVDAVVAEYAFSRNREGPIEPKSVSKEGKAKMPEYGDDMANMPDDIIERIVFDPDTALEYAYLLEEDYRKGGYKEKSDLRRAAKNWIENRRDAEAAPRTDLERSFQQQTVEQAQKIIKRRTGDTITIADIQAALWYYEKDDLFKNLGGTNKKSEAADYEGAAKQTVDTYEAGDLYLAKTDGRYVYGNKGDYLQTKPELVQRQAIEIPAAELAGRKINLQVFVEETNETATLTVDAKAALDDTVEREQTMQRLLECLSK